MKKMFLIALIFLGLCTINYAQQPNRDTSSTKNNATTNRTGNNTTDSGTWQDYERMLEAQLEVDFRKYAIDNLGLTKQEIIAFDPIFRAYMNDKNALVERKFGVLKRYEQKDEKNATTNAKNDDLGDAIENYWEAEIAEMELKKDYFDKLEDAITPTKAFNFFLMEEALQNRLQEMQISEFIPIIIEIERVPNREYGSDIPGDTTGNRSNGDNRNNMSPNNRMNENNNQMNNKDRTTNNQQQRDNNQTTTSPTTTPNNQLNNNTTTGNRANIDRSSIDAFDTWYSEKGTMSSTENADLSHQNIYDGLTKLTAAIESLRMAKQPGTASDKMANKEKIMKLADELRQDASSTQHADKAREAFMMTADLLKSIDPNNTAIKEVSTAANNLKANVLLTKQTAAVNNFFSKAQKAVMAISKKVEWSGK